MFGSFLPERGIPAIAVISWSVEVSQNSNSGMVFIGNDSDEIVSLITELHERDNRIHTYDNIMLLRS